MKKEQLDNFKKIARAFYQLKIKQEEVVANFEAEKKKFYSEMSEFWDKNKIKEKKFADDDFSVTKVQQTKFIWNVEKLEKRLTKEQAKKCLVKHYEINNIDALIEYLKSCGVDANKFKTFLNISKEVNQKAIEKMYDLGDIKLEELKDCYKIDIKEPYYKISVIEDKADEGNKTE